VDRGWICLRSFCILEIFGTGAVVGVGKLADLAQANLDNSVALVVVTVGIGFGTGLVWGMVTVSTGIGFGLELDLGELIMKTGMDMRGGVAGFGPENTGVGRVCFLTHGSMAGDMGLVCLIGCLCFLTGMGETSEVEVARIGVTGFGAIVDRFGVTGLTGDFGIGLAGDLGFGEFRRLTISPSERELSERKRSVANWLSAD